MKKIIASLLVIAPLLAFAQQTPNTVYIQSGLFQFINIIQILINVLMIGAFAYFLYTVFKFIGSDDKARAEKRKNMIWAIVGLAVMVSVWGLVGLLNTTTGVGQGSAGIPSCPPGKAPYYDSFKQTWECR